MLLLGQKNKVVAERRQNAPVPLREETLEYEKIFLKEQNERLTQEMKHMKLLFSEELKRRTEVQLAEDQSSEKQKKEIEEFKAQYEAERKNMSAIKGQLEEKNLVFMQEVERYEQERKQLEEERLKMAEERKEMEKKVRDLEQDKEKLNEMKRQQIKESQKVQEWQEMLKRQNQELQSSLQQKTQEVESLNQQLSQASTEPSTQKAGTNRNAATGGFGFVPDPDNKEVNLAVQFLDYTLRGREFLKIDMKTVSNMERIGEGAAAVVFKAQYKLTDVAVKKLKLQSVIKDGQLSTEYQREIEALTHISHPNLVLFMGATAEAGQPYIVTEFCHGGTLFEVLHEKKRVIPNITFR